MKIKDITVGQAVTVRRGYSVRPAVVESVSGGRVSVRFTDVPEGLRLPVGHASYLYGASVVPGAVQPA